MRHFLLFIGFFLVSLSSQAAVDVYTFDNEVEQKRYNYMIEELRCPKCQNQNLAGSDAPIAQDLRRELHRLIIEGKNDAAIKDFMVQRYGNFVLYRPPLDKNTLLLWCAPMVLLLLGFAVMWRIRQAERTQVLTALTIDEQEKLSQLLKEHAMNP